MIFLKKLSLPMHLLQSLILGLSNTLHFCHVFLMKIVVLQNY